MKLCPTKERRRNVISGKLISFFRFGATGSVMVCRFIVSSLVGLCLVPGCGQSNDDQSSKSAVTSPVSFLVSCDTDGWIVPCGCSTKQSGGLLRRGTLVETMKLAGDVVVLDAGGAAAGNSDYHQVKFEAILNGELAMGIAAHNIGEAEVKFGADVIRHIEKEMSFPFLSANVYDADQNLLTQPMRIVERNGQRFAVIGVLDPIFKRKGMTIKDPRQSILDVIEGFESSFDGIIVLAYLKRDAIFELAKQLPEVDAIIGGPTGQTISPTQVGATLVASATNKGKFVAKLRYDPPLSKKWSAEIVEVDDSIADHEIQSNNLDEYHRILSERDFEADQTGLTDRTLVRFDPVNRYAGNPTCVSCHTADCLHYSETLHSHAWRTLKIKKSHVDPYCQQCHTTGYGASGGFLSMAKSETLVNVGCESCHGPSSIHVSDPTKKTLFLARDQCTKCHDRQNSPLFDYTEYWKKITHGTVVTYTDSKVKE